MVGVGSCDALGMSFEIFVQGFLDGDAAPGDRAAAVALIRPLLAAPAREGFGRIVTADGEAGVYSLDDDDAGLMINNASGSAVWQLIVEVAREAEWTIMPVGCPPCVTEEKLLGHLPDELREDAIIVTNGADLERTVQNA